MIEQYQDHEHPITTEVHNGYIEDIAPGLPQHDTTLTSPPYIDERNKLIELYHGIELKRFDKIDWFDKVIIGAICRAGGNVNNYDGSVKVLIINQYMRRLLTEKLAGKLEILGIYKYPAGRSKDCLATVHTVTVDNSKEVIVILRNTAPTALTRSPQLELQGPETKHSDAENPQKKRASYVRIVGERTIRFFPPQPRQIAESQAQSQQAKRAQVPLLHGEATDYKRYKL
ncbi:hypothetical protein [Legionella yabuuchiae]|uniref:hypothetical protein n=1 Tax=Legionella yabuuchiae TaxID=376727 RepID=UPI001056D410|nr:hypothetical protein [Legionella yabuuchiae]